MSVESTVISITHEQLATIIEESVKHAMSEAETQTGEVATTAASKTIEVVKDMAKDNAAEGIFEMYKEQIVMRFRETVMLVTGSVLDFIFHNLLLVFGFLMLAVIITVAALVLDKKHKRHSVTTIKQATVRAVVNSCEPVHTSTQA